MLQRKYPPLFIVLFSSMIFFLAHMNASLILQLFLAGIILGYIAYFFHSIIPSIIIHSILNMLALVENNLPQIRENFIRGSETIPILVLVLGSIMLFLGMLGVKNKVYAQHKEKGKGGLTYEK